MASHDASLTVIAATGAAFYANYDGCYRELGRDRPYLVSNFDSPNNISSRDGRAFLRNSTRANVVLDALRTATNPDGSSRTEIDISYDVSYTAEGTATRLSNTLVTGSTTGLCAAGENKSAWRFLGDRKIAYHDVVALNYLTQNYAIGTGVKTTETARRAIRFDVRDPNNLLTYAVVSRTLPNGQSWAVKLISPRLLASDPLLAGKTGNFLSGLTNEDSFRLCTDSAGAIVNAALVDCSLGSNTTDMGSNVIGAPNLANLTSGNISNGDNSFTAFQFTVGEVYTFQLYSDNGWMTVNGQLGKTPIATYTQTLTRLPYTFAELFGPPPTFFVAIPGSKTLTDAQIGAAITGPTGAPLDQVFPGWSALPDGGKFGRASTFLFTQGPAALAPSPAFYPAVRTTDLYFPVANSASTASVLLAIPNVPTSMRARTNGLITTILVDRGARQFRITESWQ